MIGEVTTIASDGAILESIWRKTDLLVDDVKRIKSDPKCWFTRHFLETSIDCFLERYFGMACGLKNHCSAVVSIECKNSVVQFKASELIKKRNVQDFVKLWDASW